MDGAFRSVNVIWPASRRRMQNCEATADRGNQIRQRRQSRTHILKLRAGVITCRRRHAAIGVDTGVATTAPTVSDVDQRRGDGLRLGTERREARLVVHDCNIEPLDGEAGAAGRQRRLAMSALGIGVSVGSILRMRQRRLRGGGLVGGRLDPTFERCRRVLQVHLSQRIGDVSLPCDLTRPTIPRISEDVRSGEGPGGTQDLIDHNVRGRWDLCKVERLQRWIEAVRKVREVAAQGHDVKVPQGAVDDACRSKRDTRARSSRRVSTSDTASG